VRTGRHMNEATSDARQKLAVSDVATFEPGAMGGVPNKPLLPTTTNALDEDSLCPLRRQTGQPLGSLERATGNALRRAKRGPRRAGDEQHVMGSEQRTSLRAADNGGERPC
jgi:hypothetical protein